MGERELKGITVTNEDLIPSQGYLRVGEPLPLMCRIFYDSGDSGTHYGLESKINNWLSTNKDIGIYKILQSSANEQGLLASVITIFYWDLKGVENGKKR